MLKTKSINLTELSGLRGKGKVHLNVNGCEIQVQAVSKEQAHLAIERISDFIDDLNMVNLEVREDLTKKLLNF